MQKADLEALLARVEAASTRIEKISFEMPPPNKFTPQFLSIAIALKHEVVNARAAILRAKIAEAKDA